MDDIDELEEIEPQTLPRWITIPLGLVIAPFTLLCAIGSSFILVAPNIPISFLTISLGSVLLAGSLWMFYLSLRLLFVNPKNRSKFISPFGLRTVALVFAAIPVLSLILGTFWEKPIIHTFMTFGYIGIVIQLLRIAKGRTKNA